MKRVGGKVTWLCEFDGPRADLAACGNKRSTLRRCHIVEPGDTLRLANADTGAVFAEVTVRRVRPIEIGISEAGGLTQFGAFVEVEEDIDGLIHISDMSWSKRIKHPSEVLKKGDTVEAMVLSIDDVHWADQVLLAAARPAPKPGTQPAHQAAARLGGSGASAIGLARQQHGAQHGRGGQRDDERDHHRGRQGDGKLTEQAPYHICHK